MATRLMVDSVPPASMRSASPYLMARNASPTAHAPVAHAVAGAICGPRSAWFWDMAPAAIFTSTRGTKKGESLPGPLPCSPSNSPAAAISSIAPMPEPTATPARAWSYRAAQPSRCASARANWAAATAYAMNATPWVRLLARDTQSSGLKPCGSVGCGRRSTPRVQQRLTCGSIA